MIESLRDRPIFLCGHPRSGTSLLRSLFDGHPQVVVYPFESFFFRGFLPQAAKLNADKRIEFAARYLLQFFKLRPEMAAEFEQFPAEARKIQAFAQICLAVQQHVQDYGYRHDGDLLAAVILAFGQVYQLIGPETCYWLEKSIFNEFFAEQIFNWWPEARCIHVIRAMFLFPITLGVKKCCRANLPCVGKKAPNRDGRISANMATVGI